MHLGHRAHISTIRHGSYLSVVTIIPNLWTHAPRPFPGSWCRHVDTATEMAYPKLALAFNAMWSYLEGLPSTFVMEPLRSLAPSIAEVMCEEATINTRLVELVANVRRGEKLHADIFTFSHVRARRGR